MVTCVRAGGSITGEHGVGLDKSVYLPLIFSDEDMDAMLRVRAAFDPSGLCNPGKIIPLPRGCGEARAVANTSAVSLGEGQGEGLAHHNFVPHPSPLPEGEGANTAHSVTTGSDRRVSRLSQPKTITNARLADRLNEGRIANEFKRIVGPANVHKVIDTEIAERFEFGSQNDRALLITPANADEISELLEVAAREALAVIPAGSSFSLDLGNPLARVDVILSSRRMTKLIRHEPADLIATAEAGMTLRDFQSHLREKGQWLPIDSIDAHATLGGVVATGLSGPQQLGYGPLRSFIIGMRAVLSDGALIKSGGQVVKNVAGYDLCKLFTGSFGTLGVMTEITFKLRPLPAETRTILVHVRADEPAQEQLTFAVREA